ncbi:MAG TPA: alginate export family protein [Steroidobacteraceae bacterium]|jgi:hypothetical protein|nr:alginate export family protein [Steroidobacteraceae bacterium]
MRRILPLLLSTLAALPASGEGAGDFLREGDASLDLRYRLEDVSQDGLAKDAQANTLRLRLGLKSGKVAGFSAHVEGDHVFAIGPDNYNDTRNGETAYPVVADPEGTDLNQAWLQYEGARGTLLRAGRQRIGLDDERFIGSVGWRQNEQTFDAFRFDTKALPRTTLTYAYVDRVQRVFGPDDGAPPEALLSDSHLLNVKLAPTTVGTLTFYGYFLDFANAPQLSSETLGLRDDGEHAVGEKWKLGWTLEYAQQNDTGDNTADINASYSRLELRLQSGPATVTAGRELLGGERGEFTAAENPAFQTPLATLHRWQGWADKFLTTPSAGIDDRYLGVGVKLAGWSGQVAWHDFGAQATGASYGTERDLSVGKKFADRYDLLVKYADYAADGFLTDTTKFWVQFAASF